MTVCRYFLQGNCRFGNRCRFEHTYPPDYSYKRNDYAYQDRSSRQYNNNNPQRNYIEYENYAPEYSDRRNDYSYQDQNSRQYDNHVSYNPQRDDADSWYRHHHYNSEHRTDKAHSKKQHSKNQKYRYESNEYRNSEYERSASNYYSNKPENSSKDFTSGEKSMGRKVSVSLHPIDPSSLKRNAPSSFQDSNPLSEQGFFFDILNMSETNMGHAEKISGRKSSKASFAIDTSTPKRQIAPNFKVSSHRSKQASSDLNMNEKNMFYAEVIKKDVKEWERSNMWPFSSYCPIPVGVIDKKGRPSFPGFYDVSPEELRYEAYKARENNTINLYVALVEKAMLDVQRNRDELKEPSVEVMSIIKNFRRGKYSSLDCNVYGDISSKFSKDPDQTEMFMDNMEGQQPTTASTFSFKTNLETDRTVKASSFSFKLSSPELETDRTIKASSFSFKLSSPELDLKQTVTDDTDGLYTPLEELSLEDREAFLSSTFILGKIPTVPPPKCLC